MVGQTILSELFPRIELIESNRQVEQMTEAAPHKTMTEGEAGLVMAFSALALLALVGAAKTGDTALETGTQFAGNPDDLCGEWQAVHRPDARRSTRSGRRVLPRSEGGSSERDAGGVRALEHDP